MKMRDWKRDALLGLLPLLLGVELIGFAVGLQIYRYTDFRQFYSGAYMVRSGMSASLYDEKAQLELQSGLISPAARALPSNHPGFEYLLLVPLSLVSYKSAYLIWMGLNLCALWLCVKRLPLNGDPWLKAALVLGFAPVLNALCHGQDSIWFLLVLLSAFHCDDDLRCGLILGCGAFRFHLLLPILLVYLIWKKWKVVLGASLSGGALAAISIAVVGIKGSIYYVKTVAGSTDGGMSQRVNLWALVHTLLGEHHAIATAAWLTMSAGALWIISRKERSLASAVLIVPILSYHLLPYDLVMLLLPLSLIVKSRGLSILQILAAQCSVFPALAFLGSAPVPALLIGLKPQSRNCSPLELAGMPVAEQILAR